MTHARKAKAPLQPGATSLPLPDSAFHMICDRLPGIVTIYDAHSGQYLYVNDAVERMLGYSPAQVMQGGLAFIASLVHPDDWPRIKRQGEAARRHAVKTAADAYGPITAIQYRVRHADGHWLWLHTESSVYEWQDDEAQSILNVSCDVTGQKEVEAQLAATHTELEIVERLARSRQEIERTAVKLRASEERYQAFIGNSSEGIWRCDLDEPLPVDLPTEEQIAHIYRHAFMAEANDAMAAMYGVDVAVRLIGTRLSDLLVESDPQNTAYLRAFIEAGYQLRETESHETDHAGKDKYFMNSLVGTIKDGRLIHAWGTQRDVTEQHQATDALKKSEERLALALEASKMGMWEWDMTTGDLMWSDALKRIFGLDPRQDVTYERYLSMLYPDDVALMTDTIEQAAKTGKGYQTEHRIVWPDGSIHWILGQGQAFMEDGKPVRMIGTSVNIDERKAAERLQVEAAILSAERKELLAINAAKEEFIALASHQLRTPATSVKLHVGMLLEGYAGELKLTDSQLKMLHTAYDSNNRQLRIVDDLLRVAKIDAGKVRLKKEKVDVRHFLEEIVEDQRPKCALKQQAIILTMPAGTIDYRLDRERMRMAIENVLDNASKYSPENTIISILVRATKKKLTIVVKDEGVGIDPADQPRLFQKFTRINNPLSAVVGGTGLGLYWTNKLIDLHGGTLTLSSRPGKGSTFTVSLPSGG